MKLRKIMYAQEMHCCGTTDEDATATMTLEDGGGGEYLVLDVHQWAFSDAAEVDAFVAEMKRLLATASE